MKIMSWNILASEWIKSSYYPQINEKILLNRNLRFQRILFILQNVDADIIILQEVMPCEYEMLTNPTDLSNNISCCLTTHLNDKYFCSPLLPIKWSYDNETTGLSGNMTLLRKSIKQFKDAKHYAFDFRLYTELNQIRICNIHLAMVKPLHNNQIKILEREVLYRKTQMILGGDFNEEYNPNNYIYDLPKFNTHNIDCPTYYIEQKMNIDDIMTRGFFHETENECMIYPSSMEEGMLQYGSDHLPILVNI